MVRPASKLTDADRELIRQHKSALLAHLSVLAVESEFPGARLIEVVPERPWRTDDEVVEAPSPRKIPELAAGIRAKIAAIETSALAQGWSFERLWNLGFWDSPRGLAALLDPDDEIVEVTASTITILKFQRHIVRFQGHVG